MIKIAVIQCRKCNEKFNSMLGFQHHICLAEKNNITWRNKVGRNSPEAEARKVYPKWLPEQTKKHLDKIRSDKIKQNKPPTIKKNEKSI